LSDSEKSVIKNRTEKDVARATGQLEGTENRENADPGSGPLWRFGSENRTRESYDEDDDEDE
jgi:hypothetical protein